MAYEKHYTGYNNEVKVTLKVDGSAVDISGATNAAIRFNGTTYDKTTYSTMFDYTTSGASGILILKPGSTLPAGRDREAEIIIYDASNASGLVYGTIDLEVIDITA